MSDGRQQPTFFALSAKSHPPFFLLENFPDLFEHPVPLFGRLIEHNPAFSPRLKMSIVNITVLLGLLRCVEFRLCSKCVGVPETSPRSDESLGRLTGLSRWPCSWLICYSEKTQSTIS